MKIGLFSDAHISAGDPPEKDAVMYATLVHLYGTCDKILIVGDFLEMYKRMGGRRRHLKKVLKAYPKTFDFICRNWSLFTFLDGNHDEGCLALIPRVNPVEYIRIDECLFFHGHQADIFFAHRTMEKISESIIKFVFRVEAWVAGWTRFRVSEWFAKRQNRSRAGVERLADYARIMLEDDPCLRYAICGHTHIKDYRFFKTGQGYRNLGSYQDGDVFVLDTDTGRMDRLGGRVGRQG